MQTINGSDLPEVPTHSHSENESKANKRTRNQVIKEHITFIKSGFVFIIYKLKDKKGNKQKNNYNSNNCI